MRRRKDFTSLLRNIERPSPSNASFGVASSIAGDGKKINGQNTRDSEVRGLHIALPYGISSSGISGIRVQIITNDNENNVAVGVIDNNRPHVNPGCITIYDKSGSTISLSGDESISINSKSGSNILLNDDGSVNISNKTGSNIILDKDGVIKINGLNGAGILLNDDGSVDINGTTVKANGKEI